MGQREKKDRGRRRRERRIDYIFFGPAGVGTFKLEKGPGNRVRYVAISKDPHPDDLRGLYVPEVAIETTRQALRGGPRE